MALCMRSFYLLIWILLLRGTGGRVQIQLKYWHKRCRNQRKNSLRASFSSEKWLNQSQCFESNNIVIKMFFHELLIPSITFYLTFFESCKIMPPISANDWTTKHFSLEFSVISANSRVFIWRNFSTVRKPFIINTTMHISMKFLW